MTNKDLYTLESKLLRDINREKKLTWRKIVKLMELGALAGAKTNR